MAISETKSGCETERVVVLSFSFWEPGSQHLHEIKQRVKVIRRKTASPTHTDGWIVFARWCQCDPMRRDVIGCNNFTSWIFWYVRRNMLTTLAVY